MKILIWGLDAKGVRFAQSALARNISGQGALITGVEQPLRPGDLVGIQHEQNWARFRVIWSRDSGKEEKIQVAVQKLAQETTPWTIRRPQPPVASDPAAVVIAGPNSLMVLPILPAPLPEKAARSVVPRT